MIDPTTYVRRGRKYNYLPNDQAGGRDAYAIETLTLCVRERGDVKVRCVRFRNSRAALQFLDRIGKQFLVITDAAIGGVALNDTDRRTLELYLWASYGLRNFRRAHPTGHTAGVLVSLFKSIGIPTNGLIHQVDHQVRDGEGRSGGTRKNRRLSLPRDERRIGARGCEAVGTANSEAKA